jgi:hypothetical protein
MPFGALKSIPEINLVAEAAGFNQTVALTSASTLLRATPAL